MKVKVKSLSRVRLFATPWTVAHQTPPSMGFSRQNYWSGLPFPSPGDLPNSGIESRSPKLLADSLLSEPQGGYSPWRGKKVWHAWAHIHCCCCCKSLSRVQLFATPWTVACQGFPAHHYLLELAQTHVHWVGDAIQPSQPGRVDIYRI